MGLLHDLLGRLAHGLDEGAVQRIGFWYSSDEPWLPHPRRLVDARWDPKARAAVVRYLQTRGRVTDAYFGYSRCRFCGQNNGCKEFTDGTYLWPEGLAHYLEEHEVRLPDEVVQHMLSGPQPSTLNLGDDHDCGDPRCRRRR